MLSYSRGWFSKLLGKVLQFERSLRPFGGTTACHGTAILILII